MACKYHMAQADEIKRGKLEEGERNLELMVLVNAQERCSGCRSVA